VGQRGVTAVAHTTSAGCLVYIETSQTGNATHLGHFTGRGATCATSGGEPVDTPPFWDGEPALPYVVLDFTNEMVWTAANGDELWLRPNGGVFVASASNGATTCTGTSQSRAGPVASRGHRAA
jgi:hypothetical protein